MLRMTRSSRLMAAAPAQRASGPRRLELRRYSQPQIRLRSPSFLTLKRSPPPRRHKVVRQRMVSAIAVAGTPRWPDLSRLHVGFHQDAHRIVSPPTTIRGRRRRPPHGPRSGGPCAARLARGWYTSSMICKAAWASHGIVVGDQDGLGPVSATATQAAAHGILRKRRTGPSARAASGQTRTRRP
jgi:hypothetical protein